MAVAVAVDVAVAVAVAVTVAVAVAVGAAAADACLLPACCLLAALAANLWRREAAGRQQAGKQAASTYLYVYTS